MLKAHEKQFTLLQKLTDTVIITFLWNMAYVLRFSVLDGTESLDQQSFFKYSLLPVSLTLYFQARNKLYESQRFKDKKIEILNSIKSNIESGVVLTIILYFIEPIRLSRILLGSFITSTLIIMPLVRILQRNFLRWLRKNGRNLRTCLVFGDGENLERYLTTLKNHKDHGVFIKSWTRSPIDIVKNLKSVDLEKIDAVIIGFSLKNQEYQELVTNFFHKENVSIQIIPELKHMVIGAEVSDLEGIPVVSLNHAPIGELSWFLKRIFDVTSSGAGLILISPLLLLISLLIRLTSKGPIFYGQERMGLDGSKFTMWKFRTMSLAQNKEDQVTWTSKNNARVTRVGSILRKSSLDELPQLWNVFIGEMSLVGPRPERPQFVHQFKNEIPDYMLRHKMKAGITGLAQVNGYRGDTCLKTRINYDIRYIKTWSILLDLKIILKTFLSGFFNKNAY